MFEHFKKFTMMQETNSVASDSTGNNALLGAVLLTKFKIEMKNLEQREGFVNRHTNGLPDKTTTMRVVTKDVDGEHIYLCEWKPFDKSQYSKNNMPADGYLGTVKVIEGRCTGIGFHAWEQNNSEFVWYAVV